MAIEFSDIRVGICIIVYEKNMNTTIAHLYFKTIQQIISNHILLIFLANWLAKEILMIKIETKVTIKF